MKKSNNLKNPILELVSKKTQLSIDACSGRQTLASAKKIFGRGISPNFKKWHTNKWDVATKKIGIEIYQQTKKGTSQEIFNSFDVDLDRLCLTQHQIRKFCEKNPARCGNYAVPFAMFLFKVKGNFFVCKVSPDFDALEMGTFSNGMMSADVSRWNDPPRSDSFFMHNIIVPKL